MTAAAGAPPAEFVAFLVTGRRTYRSERMTEAAALAIAEELRDQIRRIGDAHLLVRFDAVGYPVLHLRARRVSEIGVREVRQHTRRATGQHAHPGAAEPAVDPLPGLCAFVGAPVLRRAQITGRVIG